MITHTIEMTDEQVDYIIVSQLRDSRERFLEDIESTKNGRHANIFFYGEPEKDIAEIQQHIDAITLLLSWYGIPE